jgi:hypothetical protein
MTIRVDREGLGTYDMGAVGVRSSGANLYDDGTRPDPWVERPWADKQEIAASQTLQLMSIPGSELAKIKPPVPYVLFPEQELGFVNQPLTIDQILDTDRWSPMRKSWLSPTIRPYTRADYQENTWSGTARGVSNSVNPML